MPNAAIEPDRDKSKLEGANWAYQQETRAYRQQIERLSTDLAEAREESNRLRQLNGQLQTQSSYDRQKLLKELDLIRDELKHVHARVSGLEGGLKAIQESRIWKTLVGLSSPLQKRLK